MPEVMRPESVLFCHVCCKIIQQNATVELGAYQLDRPPTRRAKGAAEGASPRREAGFSCSARCRFRTFPSISHRSVASASSSRRPRTSCSSLFRASFSAARIWRLFRSPHVYLANSVPEAWRAKRFRETGSRRAGGRECSGGRARRACRRRESGRLPSPRSGRPEPRSARRCVMITVVRPRVNCSSTWWMSCSLSRSTWLVASSRIRMAGSRRIARASAIRCRWPPESRLPRRPTIVS